MMDSTQKALRAQSYWISFAFLCYLAVGRGLATGANALLHDTDSETWTQAVSLGCYLASFVVPIGFLARDNCKQRTLARSLFPHVPTLLLFFLACYFCVMISNIASAALLQLFGLQVKAVTFQLPTTFGGWLFYLLHYTIAPAILEEFLFRGILLRRLRPFGDRLAVVVSSLLFAAVHFDLSRFCGIFLFSLFLGWVACRSDSIVPGILLHLLNNVLSCLFLFFSTVLSAAMIQILSGIMFTLCGVVAVAIFVIAIVRQAVPRLFGTMHPLQFFRTAPALVLIAALLYFAIERLWRIS